MDVIERKKFEYSIDGLEKAHQFALEAFLKQKINYKALEAIEQIKKTS